MLKQVFTAAMIPRLLRFGGRHKLLSLAGLAAFYGWRNRDELRAALSDGGTSGLPQRTSEIRSPLDPM